MNIEEYANDINTFGAHFGVTTPTKNGKLLHLDANGFIANHTFQKFEVELYFIFLVTRSRN